MKQSVNWFRVVSVLLLAALALGLLPARAIAQQPAPASSAASASGVPDSPNPFVVQDSVKRVSDHVYMIPDGGRFGVPNVGIIVGSRATLVFDTGMGPRSGEVDAREALKLGKNTKIYLSTTDFRPEHVSGGQSFPPDSVWIVPEAQKSDIDESTLKFIDSFVKRSANLADALKDVKLRSPDVVFDREATLDLGGVKAQLLWFGPAVTHGDVVVFVPEDGVLLSGNFLTSKSYPGMGESTASATNWLATLDKLEALRPRIIFPNHGELRDASLIASEREVLRALQSATRELKAQGKTAEEAGQILTGQFDVKFPDWKGPTAIPGIVRRFYAESQ
ncbi:MAG: MBL fold metallo-hydrolase [Candidatus Acidiferrales bacterium]|jgi:glyoxylase-like metal-dependent hydrolase (beta-lactamase superfamily II)